MVEAGGGPQDGFGERREAGSGVRSWCDPPSQLDFWCIDFVPHTKKETMTVSL